MSCRQCGSVLLAGKQFCHVCGSRVEPTCPHCGAEVQAGFRFCPDCGREIAAAPAVSHGAPAVSRLAGEMPEPMAQKIRATREGIEGERKQVTVLFCDLAGSTAVADRLDPEEYRELLDRYLALAIHEIYRFEGIVNQLAGDGLMALFGAPIAHEDDPQRAVLAALAIRDALAHFNQELMAERGLALPARIGINTGPVVVGTVGNDLKMDYTAIGDTTNLAARLESLTTPGTVLISEATARLVRGLFRTQAVGPLQVKGKSEPIRAYEVLQVDQAATPMAVAAARGLTPFVGRREELLHLEGLLERVRGSLPQVAAIIGEAGSGKSRLIYELRKRLPEEDYVLLEGRCAALNQMVPYAPFISMLRQFFEITADETHEAACKRIGARISMSPERIDTDFPLLCRLLSVRGGSVQDMPPEELKRETFRAVTNLVIGQSKHKPVVMIVEDLQWMDDASRELLGVAAGRLMRSRVMLIASHRPDHQPIWRTSAVVTQIRLRPLSDDEIGEILRAAADGGLPGELAQSILEKAEGSPFFAEEIMRSLREEGYLERRGGEVWLTRPVEEIRIPGTVQEVLAARLDRLGPAAKRVVQVAAVLGRQFSPTQLIELVEPEGIDVRGVLAELVERGIIHRKSLFSDDEFRFGESLTQEVAYEGLLHRQRRQLHERVGLALESGGGEPSLARASLIAHHFAHSDNREKAVEFLLHAARDAEQVPSYRAASNFYRQAWEAAEAAAHGESSKHAVERLIDATLGYLRVLVLYGTGNEPQAEKAAESGRAAAQHLGNAPALGSFDVFHGMLLTGEPTRFEDGVAMVERGLAAAEKHGNELQVVSTSRALASNYLLDGRFAEAQGKIDWVVGELERFGHREKVTDLYLSSRWMQDGTRYYNDDLEGTLRGLLETHELCVLASNRTMQSSCATLLSQIHFVRAEYEKAREWAERGLSIAEEIDNGGATHRAAGLALAARIQLGEGGQLGRYFDLVEQGLALGGNVLMSIGIIVEAILALGDVPRAERYARAARDRAAGRLREMLSLVALGQATRRFGRHRASEAEAHYGRATDLARSMGSRSTIAVASIGLAELCFLDGRRDAGAAHLQEALALSREIGLRRYEARALQLLSEAPIAVSA